MARGCSHNYHNKEDIILLRWSVLLYFCCSDDVAGQLKEPLEIMKYVEEQEMSKTWLIVRKLKTLFLECHLTAKRISFISDPVLFDLIFLTLWVIRPSILCWTQSTWLLRMAGNCCRRSVSVHAHELRLKWCHMICPRPGLHPHCLIQ